MLLTIKIKKKKSQTKKTSKQMDGQILRQANINPSVSILVETGANVSRWKIHRRVMEQDLKSYSPRKVPFLRKKHLQD